MYNTKPTNKIALIATILLTFLSIMGVTIGMLAGNNVILTVSLLAVVGSWCIKY